MHIVMPPKKPDNLGKAAATLNPFEVEQELMPIPDEYSVLPPVLASVARKNDQITDKLTAAMEEALESKDYRSATMMARAASYAQRIKVNAIDSTIKAADSSAQLIRAKTEAEIVKKLPGDEHGLSPELQKELIDLIARRRMPEVLDITDVSGN